MGVSGAFALGMDRVRAELVLSGATEGGAPTGEREVRLIAGADHTFRAVPPVRPRARGDHSSDFTPEVADMIEIWLRRNGAEEEEP